MNKVADMLNKFSELNSSLEVLPADLAAAIQGFDTVVFYTNDGVVIEKGAKVTALPAGLLELRAFDESSELHAVFDEHTLKGRIRKDGIGETVKVFDEEHLLWGEAKAQTEDGKTLLEADRGTVIKLPLDIDAPEGSRITILVRNYLANEDVGFSPYLFNDYRFVRFEVKGVQ
jgi:CRISPR-associated protein (TIGR03984 family)